MSGMRTKPGTWTVKKAKKPESDKPKAEKKTTKKASK